ncbi:hypothetical protein Plhal304r1_c050g0133501 [Plasmopara halstedii]
MAGANCGWQLKRSATTRLYHYSILAEFVLQNQSFCPSMCCKSIFLYGILDPTASNIVRYGLHQSENLVVFWIPRLLNMALAQLLFSNLELRYPQWRLSCGNVREKMGMNPTHPSHSHLALNYN